MTFTQEQLDSIADKFGLKFVDVGDQTYRFLYHDSSFPTTNWARLFPEGQYKSFMNFSQKNNQYIPCSFNSMRFNPLEEIDCKFSPSSIEELEQKIIELIEDFKQYKINLKLSMIDKDFQ